MSIYNERRLKIKNKLIAKPFVTLKELEEMFPEVSGMTLRRDIEFFEREGDCIKVRGGARSTKFINTAGDDSITARMKENVEAKERIAKTAASFLETGRSIFIDSGSTLLKMIPFVKNDRYSFTTTSPEIALELCKIGMPIVNIVGGRLDHGNQSVSGQQANKYLYDVNIDIAFISPSGISAKSGCTGGNYSECELKRIVIEKASTVILLADGYKFEKSLPYTFAPIEAADTVITDSPLPADIEEIAEQNSVKVIIAERDEI